MCECYGQISKDDPRYEIWVQVLPDAKIPLKHPLPVRHAIFDGLFYEGDPSRLSDEQKKIIVELMSKKFNVPKKHVQEGLEKGVLPIKAENVTVSICDLHFRCML